MLLYISLVYLMLITAIFNAAYIMLAYLCLFICTVTYANAFCLHVLSLSY